jgi:hypothetical protein
MKCRRFLISDELDIISVITFIVMFSLFLTFILNYSFFIGSDKRLNYQEVQLSSGFTENKSFKLSIPFM